MATLEIPDDIILPLPENKREEEIFRAIRDYLIQIKQTLIEIEGKLP